jgi:hypothetical protein
MKRRHVAGVMAIGGAAPYETSGSMEMRAGALVPLARLLAQIPPCASMAIQKGSVRSAPANEPSGSVATRER